jgi:hypothetical protein
MTPNEYMNNYRQAFAQSRASGRRTVYAPRFELSAYPKSQLKAACVFAQVLDRGDFVLLEDPKDAT